MKMKFPVIRLSRRYKEFHEKNTFLSVIVFNALSMRLSTEKCSVDELISNYGR